MKEKSQTSGFRFWALVWGLGIAGQLCWNMENQWFNTFVYEKIAKDPTIISWMVAISATATTISTFVTGTATDRRGRRRLAVSIGYILWGIFTILFGTTEFIMKGAGSGTASVLMTAGVAVVAADAIMSFFGSMGNDSGFNAWMNDHMNERNKGQIGAALATQPIIGTIVGTVAGGMLIGSENNYMRLFVVMGAFVICCGIFSLVFMKDAPDLEPHIEGSFWQQFAFTHLGNYMIYYLGFTADMMGFMEGIGLILAMLLVFPATKLINAGKHVPIAFASIFFNIVGLLVLGFFVRPENVNTGSIFNPVMLIGVFLIGVGYVVFLQTVSVWAKGLYPKEAKGQFEGIRILFFVLIPMVVAPLIANPIIKKNGEIINEYGLKEYLPTEVLFLVGAGVSLITFIPLIMAARYSKKGSAK